MFKRFINVILAVSMSVMLGVSAFASGNSDGKLQVDMKILSIETEYNVNDVYVEYKTENDVTKAIVRDKQTSKVLEVYKEGIVKPQPRTMLFRGLLSNGNSINIFLTKSFNPTSDPCTELQVVVEAKVRVNKVDGAEVYSLVEVQGEDHWLIGSGPFEIEAKRTNIRYFTEDECVVNAVGVLKTTSTLSAQTGLSFNFLKFLGFNISTTSSTNWIARKPYLDCVSIFLRK